MQLGWDQVYQGQLSIDWAKAINMVHPKLDKTGEQVMTMIQKMIWQYVLDTWALQNQPLHCQVNQLNLPDYCQAATTMYKQCKQLPLAAQEALY